MEILVPEPQRPGVEGVAEEESTPRAPVAEGAHIPVPVDAQDEGVIAVMMAPTVTA